MRFEDDYENLSRKLRMKGVSPAWRVVGILTSITTGLFALIAIALGVALVARTPDFAEGPRQNWQQQPIILNQPAPANFPVINGGDAEDQDPEPPNPPYPTVADLQTEERKPRGSKPAKGTKPTPHDRFVALGQNIWSTPPDEFPQQISLSPDCSQIAYVSQQQLWVGRMGGGMQPIALVHGNILRNLAGAPVRPGTWPVGQLVWSDLGRKLYFADSEGGLNRYDLTTQRVEPLDFHGDCPLPMPMDSTKLIYRRSHATPRLGSANGYMDRDPTEIVLRDLNTRQTRVLIPESRDSWTPLAISPNGKWLLLSSNRGMDKKKFGHERLHLLALADGNRAEPKPIGPVIPGECSVVWELDSTALIYARDQEPMPSDCYETASAGFRHGTDLFRYDVDQDRETRLSRGGGFGSPALDGNGNLLFVEWQFEPGEGRAKLHRASWASVLRFAEREPNTPPRGAADWDRLFDQVLKEIKIPATAQGEQLDPDSLAKIAEIFAKNYREQFKSEFPKDEESWKKLRRELSFHELSPAALRSRSLVIGACEGELLRRKHAAVWQLSKGGLRQSRFVFGESQDSPFAYVFNPFESAAMGRDDEDNEGSMGYGWMEMAIETAQGRPIILANNHAEAAKSAEQIADPILARAVELLKKNKGDEADQLLLEMMKDKKHERNDYLAAHVAGLLHVHKRFAAMRQLMEPRVRLSPTSQKFNLLGLAVMDTNPREAIGHFKTALRYDLRFGSAYLNMAQAYQNTNETESARWCLKRYLKLIPYGPAAQDVRQRLAALNEHEE
jgi:hypothetical protein